VSRIGKSPWLWCGCSIPAGICLQLSVAGLPVASACTTEVYSPQQWVVMWPVPKLLLEIFYPCNSNILFDIIKGRSLLDVFCCFFDGINNIIILKIILIWLNACKSHVIHIKAKIDDIRYIWWSWSDWQICVVVWLWTCVCVSDCDLLNFLSLVFFSRITLGCLDCW